MLKKTISFTLTLLLCLYSLSIPMENIQAIEQVNTPATQIIGQADLYSDIGLQKGLFEPTYVFGINGKLYITDMASSRIMVYNNYPTQSYQSFDDVIGQASINFTTDNYGGISASSLHDPYATASDGTNFFVADNLNNRILIYNSLLSLKNKKADVVLGQPDFISSTANNGGVSASSISDPRGVWASGGKLFVADAGNNRVLIWNTIPISNNTPANVVLGQPDMLHNTANNGGITAHSLSTPRAVTIINSKLYISDGSNNRVLIFNTIPTLNQTDADLEIGQPDMLHNTANNGGITAHSLYHPIEISSNGTNLVIADAGNSRVLIFNTIPSINQTNADVEIGQPDMVNNSADNGGITAYSLNTPYGVFVSGNKLYVVDTDNMRMLIYNNIPTTNQASADLVEGHPDFISSTVRDGGNNTFNGPFFTISGNKLVVADNSHNRVLIWNSVPTTNFPLTPDVILGQANMNSVDGNDGGLSAHSLLQPNSVQICNNKLIVSDNQNSRVLIWNSIPTTNQKNADVVIGQPDMSSNTPNNGGITAHSLYAQQGIVCIGNSLAIADVGNNRVLLFNNIPTSNQANADFEIGQPDMSHGGANNGGISAHSLSWPSNVQTDGTKLFITDYNNNRILIYNTVPSSNQVNADLVLGQPDMAHGDNNSGGISSKSLSYPSEVYADGTRILVSDSGNNRILGWSQYPTGNFAAADFVLGQSDFISDTPGVAPGKVYGPAQVYQYNNQWYVDDYGNSRIIIFPLGPQNSTASAPAVTNMNNINVNLSADGAKQMKVSTTDSTLGSTSWVPFTSTSVATVSGSEGPKSVYVEYQDYANYTSPVLATTTILDQSPPIEDDFAINNGDGTTANPNVTLNIEATDTYSSVTNMMVSQDPGFPSAPWEPYATTKQFLLSGDPGQKTVYIRYKDAAGNVSGSFSASIVLVSSTAASSSSTNSVTVSPCGTLSGTPNLFQIQTTKTSATLSFAPPPMPYSNFYIAYGTQPNVWQNGTQFDHGFSSGVLQYTISALKPTTTYYFKVRAGNECATGNWGNIMSATTTSSTYPTTYYAQGLSSGIQQTETSGGTGVVPNKTKGKSTAPAKLSTKTSTPPPKSSKPKFCLLWWCW